MLYRLRLDLSFTDDDPAKDVLDKALDVFSQAVTINPGTPEQEQGYIIYEHCDHDQAPVSPCQIVEQHLTP